MGITRPIRASLLALVTTSALIAPMMMLTAPAASAAEAATTNTQPATVTADALPTVQVNGVVWSQAIIGNTVYAAGEFTSARPSGNAVGVGEVARSNILAFNLQTGELIQSFAPQVNGTIKAITASPDGTRLYIGGTFTNVNGTGRNRFSALDPSTGKEIQGFRPTVNGQVMAIAATNDTVWIGGNFTAANGVARTRAAAMAASNAAIQPWAPEIPDYTVRGLVVSPDKSTVVIAGQFSSLNGSTSPGRGLGAVDSVTGANKPWSIGETVYASGDKASFWSLSTDGENVYGTGMVYGGPELGNLEGTFNASWDGGKLNWIEDCHGDTYSAASLGGAVYVATHAHYCGTLDGGFDEASPKRLHQRAIAFTKATTGVLGHNIHGGYADWAGTPGPSLLAWYPEINAGTYTQQFQGPWNVVAKGDYVVMGGEFTTVNGKAQTGLVRFGTKAVAPNKMGPQDKTGGFVPDALATGPGTVRLSWKTNFDYDDEFLKYEVIRNGKTSAPIYSVVEGSRNWWKRPYLSFTDTEAVKGTTNTYRIRVSDPAGNVLTGQDVRVDVPATALPGSGYNDAVVADGAQNFWRLGEAQGATVFDSVGGDDAKMVGTAERGVGGAINGDANTATTFSGDNNFAATQKLQQGPNTFSVEAWFKTTSTSGGKIVGFGNNNLAQSGNYDRHIYMDGEGRVRFGVYPNDIRTLESNTGLNDGQWHYVVGTLSPNGMQMFVDGVQVGSRTDTTTGQDYQGYWKIGGDSSWAGDTYFDGTIDDVAVYAKPLNRLTVKNHFSLSGRGGAITPAPQDAYGAAVYKSDPDLYWRLGEASGDTANDSSASGHAGTYRHDVQRGLSGALQGVDEKAAGFDGSRHTLVSSNDRFSDPQVFTTESWFNTRSTSGGNIVSFGNGQDGYSGSYDRKVYMLEDGRLVFGVWNGWEIRSITTPQSYNDGAWHQVTAVKGNDRLELYVDGQLVGSAEPTNAEHYDGYWRVGGDSGWGGDGNGFFTGAIDDVAVYSSALTPSVIGDHFSLGRGKPNVPPTAAFDAGATDLSVHVDAAASKDDDGRITDYSWEFGDGSTASGTTADHTYNDGGTYTVTLSVTDDRGAVTRVTKDVTVQRPNVAPAAAFTSTVSNLSASFDASGSVDPDGSISAYAWDFGDGATATGLTAQHSYAAAGTYTATLTVTDNRGGTASAAKTVTVTAPPPVAIQLAQDDFARTTANGLGSASLGGAWTAVGTASDFSTQNGKASFSLTPGQTRSAFLNSVSSDDTEVQALISTSKLPSGAAAYASVIGRKVGSDDYRARAILLTTGAVNLDVTRGSSGTALKAVRVSGLTYRAGDNLRVRLQVTGTNPTTVQAKVWTEGTAEPSAWQVTATDTTAALQTSGSIGLSAYTGTSAAANVVSFDSLWAGRTGATLPPASANQAPTSAFTATSSDLTVSVDGTSSTDPEGALSSWAWNFGDGTTGTGATATHTYATAGTYTVALKVTDAAGATADSSKTVTVTAPVVQPQPQPQPEPQPQPATSLLGDTFTRDVADGFGTADKGGAWAPVGATNGYKVADGKGSISVAPGQSRTTMLNQSAATDVDVSATVIPGQVASGGSFYTSLIGRSVGGNDYRTRVVFLTNGQLNLELNRGATYLTGIRVPGLTYKAGDSFQVRLQITGAGSGTSAIQAKVWPTGTTEPTAWNVTSSDTTAALQAPGAVGIGLYAATATTANPSVVTIDDLLVTAPR